MYIGDYLNNRIRKVTVSTGIITTIAGSGSSGYSTDNGEATSEPLSYPYGVAVDASGSVYIADQFYGRILKVAINYPRYECMLSRYHLFTYSYSL